MNAAAPPDDAVTPLTARRGERGDHGPAVWLRRQWRMLRAARIESAWASLRGVGHARNQDAVLAAAPLFAVADGVGGGRAGELASSELLAWCQRIPPREWRDANRLAARLHEADAALMATLAGLSPGGASATTLAAAWAPASGRGHIAHVGDARILQLRPGRKGWRLMRLTVDQTYANLGEAPPAGGRPDDPARMVGVGAMGQPPVARLRLRENDCLLLCSDGFHGWVPEPVLLAHCERHAALPLEELAQQLAELAAQRGSHDDISVLLVRRNPVLGARAGFWWAGGLSIALAALSCVLA